MVEDAQDQNMGFRGPVQDAMLTMNEAADVLADFRTERCRQRESAQPGKGLLETVHIALGHVFAEPGDAEFVDFHKVRFGNIREFKLSHALPGVWR